MMFNAVAHHSLTDASQSLKSGGLPWPTPLSLQFHMLAYGRGHLSGQLGQLSWFCPFPALYSPPTSQFLAGRAL